MTRRTHTRRRRALPLAIVAWLPLVACVHAGVDPASRQSARSAPASDTGVAAWIEATRDPRWKTRWDAVNALGKLGDPRGIPALVERALFDDNPHPRWRSLWALAAVDPGGARAVPLLREGLADPEPIVVRNAAVALAFFGQPEARPELLRGLADADDFRRWEAIFSIGKLANEEVVVRLIPLLDESREPSRRIRGEVALALGRNAGLEATAPLLDALRRDSSHEVRWRAAMALARLADPSVLQALVEALMSEEHPQVRESVQQAIYRLGG